MKFLKSNRAAAAGDAKHSPAAASVSRSSGVTGEADAAFVASAKSSQPLQSPDNHIFLTVRPPWTWIMQDICQSSNSNNDTAQPSAHAHMTLVDGFADLPSGKLATVGGKTTSGGIGPIGRPAAISSSTRRSTSSARRVKPSSAASLQTLRIDVVTNHQNFVDEQQRSNANSVDNDATTTTTTEQQQLDRNRRTWTLQSFHGTSEAFDGLEDKDEFVRTLQRCRCEHLELSPPSVLINWDASAQECKNLVGESMPTLLGNHNEATETVGVLKEPMGKSGAGVFFVHDAKEIHELMDRNRRRAAEEPGLFDELIAEKGRIPSWGT